MRIGGVILCGGNSGRMGQSKAMLPFGDETMLQRLLRIVSSEVSPIVVAAAANQPLPDLPPDIIVVRDNLPDAGPLHGIATGLSALAGIADAAFISGCDVPLLSPGWIRHLTESLGNRQIVVPVDDHYAHPLSAVYRTEVAGIAETLLTENDHRLTSLLDRCDTLRVSTENLRQIDPDLRSLMNVNDPETLEWALRIAGI